MPIGPSRPCDATAWARFPHLNQTTIVPKTSRPIPLLAAFGGIAALLPSLAPAAPDFLRDVRPILQKCLPCHGPDEGSRMANLRLDSHDAATGRDGGYAGLVPGNSPASRVLARVTADSSPMPPTGERLSPDQVETLREWIDAGARYEQHWAFEAPRRSVPPSGQRGRWPRNAIDSFVLFQLGERGLVPSPEADRATLARRLSLDLTGLPPDPDEVARFVRDPSPDAYANLVDQLLASPAYGERWASVWLDLARYADSMGYEKDSLRTIWPFRDWVVRALNDNLPFDHFTELQLAGDLLPDSTHDALVATGFHRNTMTNTEGGTDDEEFRDAAVKDRVATTGQVWMGLTWGCAQCHSHKFDPLSQREYYSLYAFFNQSADADKNDDSPVLELEDSVSTPVMRELPPDQRRRTFLHLSGNFMNPGEPVEPSVPDSFHPLPSGAPTDRLGLARWITSDHNPLTARVLVNRLWARLFGRGIVPTEEDFGTQGEPPTHPALLDWLAMELMEGDWDVKAILKVIVSSAAYRQRSDATAESLRIDPTGALISRGPSFRLSAEMIRDQALAASGLLSTKIGGPPVMPWQPSDVWQVVYSSKQWEPSPGEDRYRRALYTLWRRTAPHPSMTTFDAPSGETCALRRIRTNTPLQALVTLNDPTLVEAAEHLSRRAARESDGSAEGRLDRMFRLVLARAPRTDERDRLLTMLGDAADHLRSIPDGAVKLANFGSGLYEDGRRRTFVADSRGDAAVWRFTTERPTENWASLDFDDSEWASGRSGFGFAARDGDADTEATADGPATRWDGPELWLRVSFDLPEGEWDSVRAEAKNSASFSAYINGVFAVAEPYGSTVHAALPVSGDAVAALHPGRNTLAVHATHTGLSDAPRHVDVGLSGLRPPPLTSSPREAILEAAWVAAANVVLNLDEALTRR